MSNLSGAKIADECIREFEEFKLRGKYGYIMYKLDMTTMNITIDKTGAPGTSYEQFLADLPQDEARYAVKHIGYTTEDGGQRTKLVFVTWIPRDSSVKTKMLHASSLAPLKQALNGIAITLQGHTLADLQLDDEHQWPKTVEVTGDVTFRIISAGAHHSLGVTTHGEIYSWGSGPTGELGHGYKLTQETPTKITKLPEPKLRFKSVAAGHRHSLALTDDGQLYAWGNNQFGQLGLGHMKPMDRPEKINIEYKGVLKFIDIAAGADHSLALSDKGEIWSWGANSNGQLGHGDTKNLLVPKVIDMGNTDGPNDIYFNKISAGEYASGALSSKGKVFTWGAGNHGRLGHGDRANQLKPKLVEFFEAENMSMQSISVAYNHSAALNASGLLYMWGAALHGELAGNDPIHRYRSLKPTLVNTPGAVTFKSVQVGFEFAVATTYDGQLYTWGNCNNGRLGNNYNEGFVITPTRLDTRINVKEISVGRDHAIVLATGSEVPIFNAPAPLIVSRKRDKAIILETPRAAAESSPRQSPSSEITNHVTTEPDNDSGAVPIHENESSSHSADHVEASEASERDEATAVTAEDETVAE